MTRTKSATALLGAAILCGAMSSARADDLCTEEKFDARPHYSKAQTLEREGKYREAYRALGRVFDDCAQGVDYGQALTLSRQIALKLGQQEEGAKRYPEAFDWYRKAQDLDKTPNHEDADRVMMKYAKSAPGDIEVFGRVLGYFTSTRGGSGGTIRA